MSIITEIGKTVRNHIRGDGGAPRAAKAKEPAADAISATNAPTPTRRRSRGGSESALAGGNAANSRLAASVNTATDGPSVEDASVPPTHTRKTELVLALLRQQGGASIAEIMAATQWQAHSVRAFLSAKVRKNLGLDLAINTDEDGSRRYRILARESSKPEEAEPGVGHDGTVPVAPPPEDGARERVR